MGGKRTRVFPAGHPRHNVGLVDYAKEGVALRGDRQRGVGGGREGRKEGGYERTAEIDAWY